MTDNAMIVHENGNGGALSAYQDRSEVRELGDRLMAMHPAAEEVGASAVRAAAQLAILLGANPLPGVNEVHLWKDNKGRPCMSLGINYWRRKSQEWGGVLFEIQPRPMTPKERGEYSVPDGTMAAICRAVRTDDMIRFRELGFPATEIWSMCGRTGIGTQQPNEYAKSGRPSIWTSLKRAETDLLRQLFPAEFSHVQNRTMAVDAPLVTVIDGDSDESDAPMTEKRPYTADDLNRDLGFVDDGPPPEGGPEDGLWDAEPTEGPVDEQADAPPAATNGKPQASPPLPPVAKYDGKRTFGDGSPVPVAAVEAYDAYLAAHNGKPPQDLPVLRSWYKTNGSGKAAEQAALVTDDPDAAQAASDTAAGLFD